jgi:predicted transcriptional regulator
VALKNVDIPSVPTSFPALRPLPRSAKKSDEPSSREAGTWTTMGIVKRLDDQKRMIDRVHRELEELRSTRIHGAGENTEFRGFGELTKNLETALAANKRLADSVIRIRETLTGLVRENEKLREEIEIIKRGSTASPIRQSRQIHEAELRILDTLRTSARSSRDISRIVGRSREHTSRTVKKMIELGVLEKKPQTYPAKYILTKKGEDLLGVRTTSTSE